jgi:hypothetical protein
MMADGARWIWTPAQALVPSAGERLADEHGRAHLHQVATLPYGAPPEPHREWGEAALTRLCWGEVPGVIGGLPRMKPTKAHAAEDIGQLSRDLPRHQARVDDRVARKGGDPMGSGGIASANQCIGHVRLKRSGAWWSVTNAHQMLALRGATYHGTVDRVFARDQERRQDQSG